MLEPSERVVDAKFQQLNTVAELLAWGYRVSELPMTFFGDNTRAVVVPASYLYHICIILDDCPWDLK